MQSASNVYKMEDLLSCIDRGLNRFGVDASQVVYWKLFDSRHIDRSQIVTKTVEFVTMLDEMFGVGSIFVKRSILKEIESLFGSELSSEESNLFSKENMSNADILAQTISRAFHLVREHEVF